MSSSLRIYISHASEDQDAANRIYDWLETEHHTPWLAERNISGGSDVYAEMRKALRNADVFLYCISKHSTARAGQFNQELNDALAIRQYKGSESLLIIPVRLDDAPIPSEVGSIYAVDLAVASGYESLRSALQERAGRTANVVFTLHGIKTRGKWQKEVMPILGQNRLTPVALDYGNFLALQLVRRRSRERKIEWFRDSYIRECQRLGCDTPSIVAHSFGTYLVAEAMSTYSQVRFDRIIFCGAIVRREFSWQKVVERGQVRSILNQYGGRDIWARMVEWAVPDSGPSGRIGFAEKYPALIEQKHSRFRHSDYFYDLNYRDNWIPFLQGHPPGREPVDQQYSPNWRSRLVRALVILVILLVGYSGYRAWYPTRRSESGVWRIVEVHGNATPTYLQPLEDVLNDNEEPVIPVLQHEIDEFRNQTSKQPPPVKWVLVVSPVYSPQKVPRRISIRPDIDAMIACYVIEERDGVARVIQRPTSVAKAISLGQATPGPTSIHLAIFVFPSGRQSYDDLHNADTNSIIDMDN